jgi:16S rRNA (guanine527-N7)-methyltransferase
MIKQDLFRLLAEQGIVVGEKQIRQFEQYYEQLVRWNERMNLTAITDEAGVYLKHFYDSLTPSFYIDFTRHLSLVDVGAGAGFPSLPLKICFPQIRVTIVDSLNKRIQFLEHIVQTLGLEGVELYHSRAETFAQDPRHRQKYDLVTARAVARMSVLAELCLPLVHVGGSFVALKGAKGEEELKQAQQAIAWLGGEVEDVYTFFLPEDEGERHIILINKVQDTPKKYPRKAGLPNKQPLGEDA